ncbi:MAG: alkaline phosphatase PafA [Nonlabens sp.]
MKYHLLSLVFCALFVLGCSSTQTIEKENNPTARNAFQDISGKQVAIDRSPPKLVVGIVVDQMRYDYLTRFAKRYQIDGFNRLMDKGFNAKNNHYNFVPTYTAPGHAAIYTGTSPVNNGIIGNNWYDKKIKRSIYNASDENVQPVGTASDDGKMSPRRLLSTTVTDELEIHTQGRAKVIGLSLKDRGAILPAGHAADGAFWFKGDDEGNFVSSTFYMDKLPSWVKEFNESSAAESYLKEWNTLYPIGTYTASGPDNNNYEKGPQGKESPTFPYDLKELAERNGNFSILKSTPYGNSLLTDLAILAIDAEEMGLDPITDFLTVSYSSTDYIGHQYGANSVEIEDTYLRLDQEIARLLQNLDRKVGKGNYTVFLTADHGAVHNPGFLEDMKIPAGYFDLQQLRSKLKARLVERYGDNDIIEEISNNQIFLDKNELSRLERSSREIQEFISETIIEMEHIDKVFTRYALMNTNFDAGVGKLIQNGFNQQRSGDVVYHLSPAVIRYGRTGSTHGSAQSYDTHVPLLFYGKGIKKGETYERTEIIDIAPTISSLLGIPFPNAATGNPIPQVLDR